VANGLDETLHVLELGTMIRRRRRRRRIILDRTATARRLP
jgi:hypothetical protein